MSDDRGSRQIIFSISRKRLVIASLFVVGVLAIGVSIVELSKQPISSLVSGCVERYTKGLELKKYKVLISVPLTSSARDSVGLDQLDCIATKLGLNQDEIDLLVTARTGKIDNSSFQIKWRVATSCQLDHLFPERDTGGLFPINESYVNSKYFEEREALCFDTTDEWEASNIQRSLEIIAVDFRP